MSQTVDANILLFAADESSSRYERARETLRHLVEGDEIVYLFWPVLHAYLRISTHSRIFANPLPLEAAIADVEYLLSLPNVQTAAEPSGHWATLSAVLSETGSRGDLVTDAHIVALMYQYGVSTIWTHDRDFRKFDGIRVVDPFATG